MPSLDGFSNKDFEFQNILGHQIKVEFVNRPLSSQGKQSQVPPPWTPLASGCSPTLNCSRQGAANQRKEHHKLSVRRQFWLHESPRAAHMTVVEFISTKTPKACAGMWEPAQSKREGK